MNAKKVMTPGWLDEGFRHIWLPYTQMQTVKPPLPVVSAKGSRLTLADRRELLDGVASWWTTAHGYRHPHIEAAVTAQLQKLPHVMLGGFAHAQTGWASWRERVCPYVSIAEGAGA